MIDSITPIKFTENFKWQKKVLFDHQSYNNWVESTMPIMRKIPNNSKISVGSYSLIIKELPIWEYISPFESFFPMSMSFCSMKKVKTRCGLEIYKGRSVGKAYFTDVVKIPVLHSYGTVWMSLTPNEILTQRGCIRRTKGRVGIAGLGMGWAVQKILERDKVDFVTVVEREKEVIEVFGKPLMKKFGGRLKILNGDAYVHDWSAYDVSFWDIWAGMDDAAYDGKFKKIKNYLADLGKVCVSWGVSAR